MAASVHLVASLTRPLVSGARCGASQGVSHGLAPPPRPLETGHGSFQKAGVTENVAHGRAQHPTPVPPDCRVPTALLPLGRQRRPAGSRGVGVSLFLAPPLQKTSVLAVVSPHLRCWLSHVHSRPQIKTKTEGSRKAVGLFAHFNWGLTACWLLTGCRR